MRVLFHKSGRKDPYRTQKRLAVIGAIGLLLGSLWFAHAMQPQRVSAFRDLHRLVLIIDPGHGGIDGGAIAYNGVKESDLNLEIALKLRELAWFYGIDPVMTRQDDSNRTDPADYSEHEDLEFRAQMANQVQNGVLISIHQNTFPTSQPSGAQVLYGPGEESRRLGQLTHGNLISALQPENRRVAAPAPQELFLTAHADCPVILVECGFLSNLSDLQLLSDSRYQSALAAVLMSSFLQYCDPAQI